MIAGIGMSLSGCASSQPQINYIEPAATIDDPAAQYAEQPAPMSNRPIVQAMLAQPRSQSSEQRLETSPDASAMQLASSLSTNIFSERECLARAMYFEAKQNDHASLLAAGTVVANRAESGRYPPSWCAVVAQAGQFTSNPLSRQVGADYGFALDVADEIQSGIRYPGLEKVYHFHTYGYKSGFAEKKVATIGGNTYYKLFTP